MVVVLFSQVVMGATEDCKPGMITYVDDGDTAKIKHDDGVRANIRFYGVDSPEKKWAGRWPAQPFSGQAKEHVKQLILNKRVCVRYTGDQTYSRKVGEIFINNQSVSRSVVAAGLAWWNTKYAPNDTVLRKLESSARKNKKGLWSQAKPEAPWTFRRRHRK